MKDAHSSLAARLILSGGIGVLPTDTIYGVVGSALRPKVVQRLYRLRKRNLKKPMIVLIGSVKDLARFGVAPNLAERKILRSVWPGPASVILPCPRKRFFYLHRGTKSLAFRLPRKPELRSFLMETGPLVAPSANPEGEKPAETVRAAKHYFGDGVDFYVDEGTIRGSPSRLYQIVEGKKIRLR